MTQDFVARFGGVGRLYGEAGWQRLSHGHVAVVGVGGVGSWVVEALARTGVGALTLVDLDEVCVSNVNRQLPALAETIGRAKVTVLAERARSINPECAVTPVQEFLTAENGRRLLATRPDYVVDAIDSVADKCALITLCRELGIPVIVCGGAGGRRDVTQVRVADLSKVTHDRLLCEVRRRLRQDHGFPPAEKKLGVECVFSPEPPVFPQADGSVGTNRPVAVKGVEEGRGLGCDAGLGSACFVTGAFGFVAAGHVVARLVSGEQKGS
jgi:tRNA A37 threonylcarbamoyladenosine dehydratase